MPAAKKKVEPKKRPKKKQLASVQDLPSPVVLNNGEVAALRNRFEGMELAKLKVHDAGRIYAMVQESYGAYVRELREAHDLPAQFTVDFETGIVTADESGEEGEDEE